jgi:large subunit ribosomal protein L29
MSKRVDSLNALRDLSPEELTAHLRQQRRRLFEIRFQQATGQVENHREIRAIHKEIARAMTVQMESGNGRPVLRTAVAAGAGETEK